MKTETEKLHKSHPAPSSDASPVLHQTRKPCAPFIPRSLRNEWDRTNLNRSPTPCHAGAPSFASFLAKGGIAQTSTLNCLYTVKDQGVIAGVPRVPRFWGPGLERICSPLSDPRCVPHPFAFFADGWETTNLNHSPTPCNAVCPILRFFLRRVGSHKSQPNPCSMQ
jgi:hypothetical protein